MKILRITCSLIDGVQFVKLNKTTLRCPEIGKTKALVHAFKRAIRLDDWDLFLFIDDDMTEPSIAQQKFVARFRKDPRLGVLCGERYFTRVNAMPEACRHVWGVCAAPVMQLLKIPCGAFMAIRPQLIPNMLDYWQLSIFDDTMAADVASTNGMTFDYERVRIPENTSIGWRELWDFTVRQYIDVKAHGPWVKLSLCWAVLLYATIFLWWWIPKACYLVYFAIYLWAPMKETWRTWFALPIAQLLFLVAIPAAACKRRMVWKVHNYKVQ